MEEYGNLDHTYNDALFAQFYDIIIERMGRKTFELDFWESCAKLYGDPILYHGCGTGRLLLPLAEEGYFIVGVDFSPCMLKILEQKLNEAYKHVRNKVQLKLCNMIDPVAVIKRRDFRLIMFPGSQFLHLKTDQQRLTCLRNNRTLLADDGVIVISNAKLHKSIERFKTISNPDDLFTLQVRITWKRGAYRRYFKLIQEGQEHLFWWSLYPIEASHMKRLINSAGLRCIPIPPNLHPPIDRNVYFCRKRTGKNEIRVKNVTSK